jgi:hypothetical protein
LRLNLISCSERNIDVPLRTTVHFWYINQQCGSSCSSSVSSRFRNSCACESLATASFASGCCSFQGRGNATELKRCRRRSHSA